MPKFTVSKSIFIDAPVEKIWLIVRDFPQWKPWSPWLIAEPECKVGYGEDGKSYSWDGEIVGAGEMKITGETRHKSIDYRLTFMRPFKSVADVRFLFVEKNPGVEVTWMMNGSLPFFLFFMKGMMKAFVGMDYDRGLAMLKDYAGTGKVPCKLEFHNQVVFPGLRYIGVRSETMIKEIDRNMSRDMARVRAFFDESGRRIVGSPLSIYHRWKPVKGTANYTLAFPTEGDIGDLPDEFVGGELDPCEVYQVRLTGPYRHIGNAWSAGMMHGRARVFKQNKKRAPFEIYENSPDDTDETNLVTVVHFPLKG